MKHGTLIDVIDYVVSILVILVGSRCFGARCMVGYGEAARARRSGIESGPQNRFYGHCFPFQVVRARLGILTP